MNIKILQKQRLITAAFLYIATLDYRHIQLYNNYIKNFVLGLYFS